MYVPAPYAQDDFTAIRTLVGKHPFATIAVNGSDGPVLAHAPLAIDAESNGHITALIGHIARANPFWHNADGAHAVAVFSGPDGYVSPSFYPSKAEHGKVVPTWAYARVEVRGVLRVIDDPALLRPYVDAPTAMMEGSRPTPWSAEDAPPEYITSLLGRIVGLRINARSVEASWKLDQKKTAADRKGSANGLKSEGGEEIAAMIETALHRAQT